MSGSDIFYLIVGVIAGVCALKIMLYSNIVEGLFATILLVICAVGSYHIWTKPRIGDVQDTCVAQTGSECTKYIKEIYASTDRGPMWLEVKDGNN